MQTLSFVCMAWVSFAFVLTLARDVLLLATAAVPPLATVHALLAESGAAWVHGPHAAGLSRRGRLWVSVSAGTGTWGRPCASARGRSSRCCASWPLRSADVRRTPERQP